MCDHNWLLVTPLRKDSWKLCLVSLEFACVSFPFADFAWYSFNVNSHSYQYDDMLNHLSPPTELGSLGIVLGRAYPLCF